MFGQPRALSVRQGHDLGTLGERRQRAAGEQKNQGKQAKNSQHRDHLKWIKLPPHTPYAHWPNLKPAQTKHKRSLTN
jgi:hypothetical protein